MVLSLSFTFSLTCDATRSLSCWAAARAACWISCGICATCSLRDLTSALSAFLPLELPYYSDHGTAPKPGTRPADVGFAWRLALLTWFNALLKVVSHGATGADPWDEELLHSRSCA